MLLAIAAFAGAASAPVFDAIARSEYSSTNRTPGS
jgi:hypothetical protein